MIGLQHQFFSRLITAFVLSNSKLKNPLVKSKARQPVNPEVFELLTNYRSHGGIVACAASIIDLISSMFPYSIDKLQREASIVAGPKPLVFRDKVVHWEMFLCDSEYVLFIRVI